MSAMGNLVLEIQELLSSGYKVPEIAKMLNIPESWVRDAIENF